MVDLSIVFCMLPEGKGNHPHSWPQDSGEWNMIIYPDETFHQWIICGWVNTRKTSGRTFCSLVTQDITCSSWFSPIAKQMDYIYIYIIYIWLLWKLWQLWHMKEMMWWSDEFKTCVCFSPKTFARFFLVSDCCKERSPWFGWRRYHDDPWWSQDSDCFTNER